MNFRNKKIRVVFLGDKNVGKTSLISALTDSYPDHPVQILEPKILPPTMQSHSHEVTTILIDTSTDVEYESKTNEEIKGANAIVLQYDMISKTSVDNMNSYWLPRIMKYNSQAPIIVLGCKLDLIKNPGVQDIFKITEVIKILMKNCKQIEIGFECSALSGKNLSDLVSCIHKVVLFPLSPLYDTRLRVMKDEFRRALQCIFRICDTDCDGRLSDTELKSFQQDVFRGELSNKDIRGIKEVIREELDDHKIGQGINLEGFIILQKKCIELMKIQTCWTILRYFGFDDNLRLHEDLFQDSLICNQDYKQCFKYLRYIGFTGTISDTFKITNPKTSLKDFLKLHNRQVLNVMIIGPDGVGKSKLLDCLITKTYSESHIPSPSSRTVVTVDTYNDEEKTIIFTEIPTSVISAEIENPETIIKYDLVLILFDEQGKAASFLDRFKDLIPDTLPRMIVKTKSDTSIKKRKFDSLAAQIGLDTAEYNNVPNISCKENSISELNQGLSAFILNPSNFIPGSAVESLKAKNSIWDQNWGLIGVGLLGVAAIFFIVKYKKKINVFSFFKK